MVASCYRYEPGVHYSRGKCRGNSADRCRFGALSKNLQDHALDLQGSGIWPAFNTAVFTWMAVANQGQEFYGTFWVCLSVLSWLFLAMTVSYYARGYLAERRGVRPAPPDKRPDLALKRRMLIIFGILVSLIFLTVIYKFLRHPDHFTGPDWAGEVILPAALLVQLLANYLRDRFWDASFE